MKIFEEIESEVQSYARNFPRIFDRAQGEYIYDEEGNQYLDFLAGAGSLNYASLCMCGPGKRKCAS